MCLLMKTPYSQVRVLAAQPATLSKGLISAIIIILLAKGFLF